MPSYVILQEDTPVENASLTGKGRHALLKAASRPVHGDISQLQIGALENAKIKEE